MVKHNNVIPNAHFRKEWQERVKTWLDQPLRKRRRRLARKAKAAAIAPRPVAGSLRPVVRCQTVRYNIRVRAGRGFTLEELRAAGVSPKVATTIGIAVDHRRTNKSAESLNANVARLKEYMSKLVLFPRKSGAKNAAKKEAVAGLAVASAADRTAATQLTGEVMPIRQPAAAIEFVSVADALAANTYGKKEESKSVSAYRTLRLERSNKKLEGRRKLKAAAAATGASE